MYSCQGNQIGKFELITALFKKHWILLYQNVGVGGEGRVSHTRLDVAESGRNKYTNWLSRQGRELTQVNEN